MGKNSGLLVKKLREDYKNLQNKIKYKLFNKWRDRQYRKFFKSSNYDFDFCSYLLFLETKFTCMGLYFAKYGVCEDNKIQARQMWKARDLLKSYLNASITAEEICQKEFVKKFGCKYETELISTKNESGTYSIDFVCVSPVENKEEAEEFWKSLKEWELARTIEVNSKKLLFEYISENLESWWD